MRRSPHLVVGFGAFPGFEFQCGQFDGAHEAGGLFEMIILGVGLAIDDCLLGERVDDGGLQCVGDDLLSVVIVDLDGVVRLKPVEVRQQVVSQDNARLLAQIRLWVPMKRTWPGFGMTFQSLTHENRESAMAKAGTVAGEMEERKLKAAANRLREGVGETAACLLPGFPANQRIKQSICAKKRALSFNKCEIQVTI